MNLNKRIILRPNLEPEPEKSALIVAGIVVIGAIAVICSFVATIIRLA